jgi:hypothetical protein
MHSTLVQLLSFMPSGSDKLTVLELLRATCQKFSQTEDLAYVTMLLGCETQKLELLKEA